MGCRRFFKEVFPIDSYDEEAVLDFVITRSASQIERAWRRNAKGQTYSAPLHVTSQLREEKVTQERSLHGANPAQ